MSPKSPAYQRYPKDYMSDGNVLRMSFEERGIYDWLLDSCWLEDGIPDDVGELARICSLTRGKMAKAWERIRACFAPHPRKPGWLTNARLEKERQAQAKWREKSAKGGRRSAEVRAKGGATVVEPPLQPKPNTAVRSSQSAIELPTSAASPPRPSRSRDYSQDFERAWALYPKRAGGNPKPRAWKAWRARLRAGVDPQAMIAGVERYAAFVRATGKAGTEYVLQAATFFGPDEHWTGEYKAPDATKHPREAAKEEAEAQALRAFHAKRAGLVPVIEERRVAAPAFPLPRRPSDYDEKPAQGPGAAA